MSLADKNRIGQQTSADSMPVVIASDQSPVPVSGSITATNPSVGANNAAIPTSSTQVGGSDGTTLQAARVFDADSGGGTQYVLGTILRASGAGGSVETGTSTSPLRIDPTGTTPQPVTAASLPLPTGAATSANQTTGNTSLSNIDTNTQYSAAQSAAFPTRNAVIAGNGSTTIPTAATEGTTTRQWYSTTGRAHTMNDPGYDFAAVTPNDGANLPTVPTRALYVGTGGNITVDSGTTTTILFRNVPPGTMLPIAVYRVRVTGTTASNIVAIY